MKIHLANRRWRIALAVLAAIAFATCAAVLVFPVNEHARRATWRSMLRRASAEDRPAVLEQLRQREPDLALPLLADLLGDEENELAVAAQAALHQQLEDWRAIPVAETIPRVATLADELAARVDDYPPEGKRAATALAREIVDWPLDGRDERTLDILSSCETIFSATPSCDSTSPKEAQAIVVAQATDRAREMFEPIEPPATVRALPLLPGELPPATTGSPLPTLSGQSSPPESTKLLPESPPEEPGEIYSPLAIPLDRADRFGPAIAPPN